MDVLNRVGSCQRRLGAPALFRSSVDARLGAESNLRLALLSYIDGVARGYRQSKRTNQSGGRLGHADDGDQKGATVLGSDGEITLGPGDSHISFVMDTCSLNGTGRILPPSARTFDDTPHLAHYDQAVLISQESVTELRDVTVSMSATALTVLPGEIANGAPDAEEAYRAHAMKLTGAEVRVMQEVLWERDDSGGPTLGMLALHLVVSDGFSEEDSVGWVQQLAAGGLIVDIADCLRLTPHGLEVLERV